ncbi:MAG TPA: HK97 gp10 family phage protein [Bacillus bacterium]|nr:HK97 gp10 family phage protein [Bacillus sp. (in: firmicutes)]
MASEMFSFSMEGIEAIISQLDRYEQEVDKRLKETLENLAEKIIADAKKLAPIDSGDLEAALIIGEVVKTIGEMYIDFGTSPEVDEYATIQHEGFRKTKDGEIVQLTPGEKIKSKSKKLPSHLSGYTPGKKYLENAIKANETLIIEELKAAIGME